MQDDRDEYEPIIASRPHRPPVRDEAPPLWRLVLALTGGLAVVLFLAWWFFGRPSDRSEPTAVQMDTSLPEVQVEREEIPPAKDSEQSAEVAQAPAPPTNSAEPAATAEPGAMPQNASEESAAEESVAEASTPETNAPEATAPEATAPVVVPNDATQASAPPAVSLLLTSPDPQVRFEVRGPLDSTPVTSKAGDVVELAPETYRVLASGPELETIEREIELSGGGPAEFSVELCAQPEQETQNLAGQVLEQRACASTIECESTFMILSEYAEQLVKDLAFRRQQCAKWRASAEPEGKWTLDTKCDGEVSATTCRVEISAGACTVTGPRRTVRGEACPRAELL